MSAVNDAPAAGLSAEVRAEIDRWVAKFPPDRRRSAVIAARSRYLVVVHPPSTAMVWPLMKLPSLDARKKTAPATSSTVPSRLNGVISWLVRWK